MQPEIKLLSATQDPEFMIVKAARICYNSEDSIDSRWQPIGNTENVIAGNGMTLGVPMVKVHIGKKDEVLLRKLMTNNHNACLRFAFASFQISNISRVCSHQLVRISHAGLLQRSQRYCNEGETEFVFPDALKNVDNGINSYLEDAKALAEDARRLYDRMVDDGVKEEDARYILPAASSTQINISGNFQMWKHLLHIRLNRKVQYETRLTCAVLCERLYELAPIVFESDFNKLDDIEL